MLYRLGFDPGYGNFKIALIGPDGVRVAVIPSVVGVGDTNIGMLSRAMGDLGRQRRRRLPDRVVFEGVTYLVGENVARYTRPMQRMDFNRLSNGPELRALFYDSVYQLLEAGRHRACLMIGLPVEVMSDEAMARDTLRSLREWMITLHQFTVNDEHVSLVVEDIDVMPQPSGTFFAWGLDNRGQWRRPASDLRAPVAICDVGFNTLDLFAVEGGEVSRRFTNGDTLGMRRAAEILDNRVQAQYGKKLSLHEADSLLRERKPVIYTSKGEVDLTRLAQQARDGAAAEVLRFVEGQWEDGMHFAHVLFTGGGSEMMRDVLLREYPSGVILPNAVAANAIGLAKYATRVHGE